jgi:hypothetical protein
VTPDILADDIVSVPGFGAQFGYAVSLSSSGRTAVIGAPIDDGQTGAAWYFAASGDTTPPETTLTSVPPDPAPINAGTFSFSSDEPGPGTRFQCSLDGETFYTCPSPTRYTALTDGLHSFRVRAVDADDNGDPTPASYMWTVASTPPDTTIAAGPAPFVNVTTATFALTSTVAGSTFECRLDDAAFTPCTAAPTVTDLAPTAHTFDARATDPDGSTDVSAASRTWRIDLTAPQTTITSSPPTPSSSSHAIFAFESSEDGSTFECRVDAEADFTPCGPPPQRTGLSDGQHTFRVRAVDAAGNRDATPATVTWIIENQPPETQITQPPPSASNTGAVSVAFDANEPATFTCSVDDRPSEPCESPLQIRDLVDGGHRLAVTATDLSGKSDPTPATATWTIDRVAPSPGTPIAPVDVPGIAARPTFTFARGSDEQSGLSSEDVVVDGARLATVDAATCVQTCSVTAAIALADGQHTWGVITRDRASNESRSPTVRFVVDALPPQPPALLTPPDGAFVNTRTPLLRWLAPIDIGSSVDEYEVTVDGETQATPAPSIQLQRPLADGAHTWSVVAIDAVGNRAAPVVGGFVVDTVAPVAVLQAPTPVVAPFDEELRADRSYDPGGQGIASYAFDRDGDGTYETPGSAVASAAISTPGTYSYGVRVTDAAGNVAIARAEVVAQARVVGPKRTLSIVIAHRAFATRTLAVPLTITVVPGTRSITISNDGSPEGGRDIAMTSTSVEVGDWRLASDVVNRSAARDVHVFAYNAAGKQLGGEDDQILYDPIPPVIEFAGIAKSSKPKVHVKARDRVSGVQRIRVKAGHKVVAQRVRKAGRSLPSSLRLTVPKVRARVHLTVEVTDRAGNASTARVKRTE